MEAVLKCTHPGCNQSYKESENNDKACHFHSGKVVFHDIKKGWACCDQYAYDWEDFKHIPPCSYGRHTNEKLTIDFKKSELVAAAQRIQEKKEIEEGKLKTIDQYLEEESKKKAE